ncbi:MAG: hypothetical protein ABEJ62_02630 [Candidatus Nanohaloarchaea archaeon]
MNLKTGLLYTTETGENLDSNLETFDTPSREERVPYGNGDQQVARGENLDLYVVPSQSRLTVRMNGREGYGPSTEELVSSYLEEEHGFDPATSPGVEGNGRGRLEGLWEGVKRSVWELPGTDRELVELGAEIAADTENYYRELAETAYRNR